MEEEVGHFRKSFIPMVKALLPQMRRPPFFISSIDFTWEDPLPNASPIRDWLLGNDLRWMLDHLKGHSARQLRLFAYHVWSQKLDGTYAKSAGEATLAEMVAYAEEGKAWPNPKNIFFCLSQEDVDMAVTDVLDQLAGTELTLAANLLREVFGCPLLVPGLVLNLPNPYAGDPKPGQPLVVPEVNHLPLLDPQVQSLAKLADQSRDYSVLPPLSDALEDAGCTDPFLLNHLRGKELCPHCLGRGKIDEWLEKIPHPRQHVMVPMGHWQHKRCFSCQGQGWVPLRSPHVLGCWAVDRILGQTNPSLNRC